MPTTLKFLIMVVVFIEKGELKLKRINNYDSVDNIVFQSASFQSALNYMNLRNERGLI